MRAPGPGPRARRARPGRRPGCGRPRSRRTGCRPGRRSRSGRSPRRPAATTWLFVMMWPCRSSTKPEPVAPPRWPSYSARICTVLGSSRRATSATEPFSTGSGASETVSTLGQATAHQAGAVVVELVVGEAADDTAERRRAPARGRTRPARPSPTRGREAQRADRRRRTARTAAAGSRRAAGSRPRRAAAAGRSAAPTWGPATSGAGRRSAGSARSRPRGRSRSRLYLVPSDRGSRLPVCLA